MKGFVRGLRIHCDNWGCRVHVFLTGCEMLVCLPEHFRLGLARSRRSTTEYNESNASKPEWDTGPGSFFG